MCAGIRYAGHCGTSIRASARVVCFFYSYILTVHSRCPIRPAFLMMALIIRHVYNPPASRSGSYTFTFPCLCETRKNYYYGGIFKMNCNSQEAEHCRSQILEVKGPSCPVVVVLNKTDLIRSGSVSSEPQTDDDKSENHQRASGSGSGSAPDSRAASDGGNFLCQEMVESLVTCDWGHGFVPASAKNNINVVQVRAHPSALPPSL